MIEQLVKTLVEEIPKPAVNKLSACTSLSCKNARSILTGDRGWIYDLCVPHAQCIYLSPTNQTHEVIAFLSFTVDISRQEAMCSLNDIEVHLTSTADPHCIELLQRQQAELLSTNPTLTPISTDIPIFFKLTRGPDAIACGGLRLINDQRCRFAEIKRVYVIPEARGRENGIADLLMKRLELHAAHLGWSTVRLQTSKDMVVANRFYERHGYRLISNYGDYVSCLFTISYEKTVSST